MEQLILQYCSTNTARNVWFQNEYSEKFCTTSNEYVSLLMAVIRNSLPVNTQINHKTHKQESNSFVFPTHCTS